MNEILLSIARHAAEAKVSGVPYEPPTLEAPWDVSRAVFVTLRRPNGDLRGCIGHLRPVHGDLATEIAKVAEAAATRDPRFKPVQPDELDGLSYSISLLEPAEPVTDRSNLDPHRYGVIVRAGSRRGVLLPDIEGVDTVDKQLQIACRKANIRPDEPYEIERFEVHTYGKGG